jgi:hypothetical protein
MNESVNGQCGRNSRTACLSSKETGSNYNRSSSISFSTPSRQYRSPWWAAVGDRVRATGCSLSIYDPR